MRALLAAALLLSIFILFGPHRGFGLSENSPGEARVIRLERSGMPEIRLERKGNEWEIKTPVRGLARPDTVRNLLAVLDAKSDRKLEAKDLSRFGLDRPVLRLIIDSQEYDFGMLNPLTGQQYVRKGGAVFLISPKYALVPSLSELEADHA